MKTESIVSKSPGRINIIGEHTDYNEGFVMPAAIDKSIIFNIKKNGTANFVNIHSENMVEDYSFDLSSFSPISGGWPNYVMGVVHELQKLGASLSGFDGRFGGDVPIGGGMSSSAALECSLAYGLNELFHLGLDKWTLIKASQMAEHHFAGIKCGIMDQFASMMGKKNQVMLMDCRSLNFEYYPFDLKNYQLLLLNTNVSHSLASSEYNTRREECEYGVSVFQQEFNDIKSLRDVSIKMLQKYKDDLPIQIYKRCHHVIHENSRVQDAAKSLLNNDFQKLGQLVYQSHFSLQNDYEVSCPELDYLVELTLDKEYILGSRMMGGGFGGCTINIIDKKHISPFTELASLCYKKKFGVELSPFFVSIENGSALVS